MANDGHGPGQDEVICLFPKIYEVCDFYRARRIENENNYVIFEIAGASERINRFIKEVNQITKIEIVRSGPVAISTHKNTKEE